MTSWQLTRVVAGTFILLSLALGVPGSPVFVSTWWLAFTAFVGLNLLQSGLTRWCLMERILRALGVRPSEGCGDSRCNWSVRRARRRTGCPTSACARSRCAASAAGC